MCPSIASCPLLPNEVAKDNRLEKGTRRISIRSALLVDFAVVKGISTKSMATFLGFTV